MLYAFLKPHVHKLGKVAYYYGKNETANQSSKSDLKPQQGDFKGYNPVYTN